MGTSKIATVTVTADLPSASLIAQKSSSVSKTYTFIARCTTPESAVPESQSDGIRSCTISFGDGTTRSIATTTTHISSSANCYYPKDVTNGSFYYTYTKGGTYTVNLTAVDQYGGTYTNSTSLRVNEPSSASISVTRRADNGASSGMLLAAIFNAECSDSDGSIKSCIVNFGDGSSQSLSDVPADITSSTQRATVTHNYATGGTYTVNVTSTDSDDEITTSRSVSVTTNAPPTAEMSADKLSGKIPMKVKFTTSCSDPDGSVSSCSVNFGDGSSRDLTPWFSSLLGNKKAESTVEHTYTKPGTYYANITASDDKGAKVSKSITIQVGSDKLPASINVKNVTGAAPLTVNFSASCRSVSSQVSKCTLDFGDDPLKKSTDIGQLTSPAQSVSGNQITHTYLIPGRYTATLTTTDIYGNTNSSDITVTVLPKTKKR